MYNNSFQGNGLPFSATELQAPLTNYQIYPQMNLEPHLSQFGQLIQPMSAALIAEILNKAQTGPLRTFMFNQLSVNGFNNQEFYSLIRSSIEYMYLMIQQGNANPNQVLGSVAGAMCQFHAALNVRTFPALSNYCNIGTIQGVWAEYERVGNQIQMLRNSVYNRNNNNQNFNNFGAGNVQQNNRGTATQSGLFVSDGTNGMGSSQPNSNNGIMERSYMSPNQSENIVQQNSNSGQQFQQPTSIQENIVDTKESLEYSEQLVVEASKNWLPTMELPYRPAYQPSTTKLVARRKGNNFVYQIQDKGAFEMDQDQHRITKLFGTMPSVIGNGSVSSTSTALADAVSDAKVAETGKDINLDSYSRMVLEGPVFQVGFDSVWVSGIIEHQKRTKLKVTDRAINILQWCRNIVAPNVVANPAGVKILRSLSKMNATQLIACVKNNLDVLDSSTIRVLDERLTEATNRALRVNMSISSIFIQSFIDDWVDLVDLLSKRFGDEIASIFVANQDDIIAGAVSLMDQDCVVAVTHDAYAPEEPEEGETYGLQYFVERASFTMLNFFSADLDIDFEPNTSALLSKLNARPYYELAEQIYKEFGEQADRHYLRTVDGRILEISRGWLSNNAYIISLKR